MGRSPGSTRGAYQQGVDAGCVKELVSHRVPQWFGACIFACCIGGDNEELSMFIFLRCLTNRFEYLGFGVSSHRLGWHICCSFPAGQLFVKHSKLSLANPSSLHLFRIDAWTALLTLLILLAFIACIHCLHSLLAFIACIHCSHSLLALTACIHCLPLLRPTLSTLARPLCTCFGLLWPALY